MRKVAIRHQMGKRPDGQRHKQRMTHPANQTWPFRIKAAVTRTAEGERVRPANGQGNDYTDREHGCKRNKILPGFVVPQGKVRGTAGSKDKPGQHT